MRTYLNKRTKSKIFDDKGYLLSNIKNFTPLKVINSNYITTDNMAFPITANGMPLFPNTGDYYIPGNKVVEKPMFQSGGNYLLDGSFMPGYYDKKTDSWVQTGEIIPPKNKQNSDNTTPQPIPDPFGIKKLFTPKTQQEQNRSVFVPYEPKPVINNNTSVLITNNNSGDTNTDPVKTDEEKALWHKDTEEFDNGLLDTSNTSNTAADGNNKPKKPKIKFPSISAVDTLGVLNYAFTKFATMTEEARQKKWMQKQMADRFNQTYSNVQNDYGVDPYEQTGQLRSIYQKGGEKNQYQEFFNSYLSSPAYKDRLKKSGYTNIDRVISDRLSSINNSDMFIKNNSDELQKYVKTTPRYKYGGISIKKSNEGKFTEYAKSKGMSVQEAARYVMEHSTDPTLRKRANFAINASKWKHQMGGKFNVIDFLYGDDEDEDEDDVISNNKEATTQEKKAPRVTENDVDDEMDLSMFNEYIFGNPYSIIKNRKSRKNNSSDDDDDESQGSIYDNIARGESNSYYDKNPNSSATGKYQFTTAAQKDAYNQSGGKDRYGSFENYQKLFKTSPQVQEEAMRLRMNQAVKSVGNDPIALTLYHYGPKFAYLYKKGRLDLDKKPMDYGVGTSKDGNPTFRDFLKTHGFPNLEKGGTYDLSENQIQQLINLGYKIKRL